MSDILVLELLRAIRGDISDLKMDAMELKERIGNCEAQTALLSQQYASMSRRLDLVGNDVAQIKRRLELVDAS